MGGIFRHPWWYGYQLPNPAPHSLFSSSATIVAPAAGATASVGTHAVGSVKLIVSPAAGANAAIPTPDGADAIVGPLTAEATASIVAPTLDVSSGASAIIEAPAAGAFAFAQSEDPLPWMETTEPPIPAFAIEHVVAAATAAGLAPTPLIRIPAPTAGATASVTAPITIQSRDYVAIATASAPAPTPAFTFAIPTAAATASVTAPLPRITGVTPIAIATASLPVPVVEVMPVAVAANAVAGGIVPTIIKTSAGPLTIVVPAASAIAVAIPPPNFETLQAFEGPETTLTWAHLLRESKDPGEADVYVGTSRWTGGR